MSSDKAQAAQAAKIAAKKAALRERMRAIRSECAKTVAVTEETFAPLPGFCEAVKERTIGDGGWCGTYLSVGDEFPTAVLNRLLRRDYPNLCVPCWDAGKGVYVWGALTEPLAEGPHGIPQPAVIEPIPPAAIDLAFVPGLAFDRLGNRLGHGGGVYDRLLAELDHALVVGLCYSRQLRDKVPATVDDVPVDMVITERRATAVRRESTSYWKTRVLRRPLGARP